MECRQCRICVSSCFFALLVAVLLFLPVPWVVAWFVASTIHEIGHLTALFLSKNRDWRICLSVFGPRIQYYPASNAQHIACTFAGPCVGVLPILFTSMFPRVAICAAIQTFCNLLPFISLDGGQIVFATLKLIMSDTHARRTLGIIELITILILITITIYVAIKYSFTLFPLLGVSVLVIQTHRIKFSCKQRRERVQ